MVRGSRDRESRPPVDVVLEAVEDPDCRAILRTLEAPMTAKELSERCDIPLSTTYRKLTRLTEATLLEELTEVRPEGHHRSRFRPDFTEIVLKLSDDRELEVTVVRPTRPPDERLELLWTEVQQEVG